MRCDISHNSVQLFAKDYMREYRDEKRFIAYCRECRRYGKCWACPPYPFDASSLIGSYEYVNIIGTKITPSGMPAESEAPSPVRLVEKIRPWLDARIRELEGLRPGSLAFYAGTCHICPNAAESCARISGLPCRNPSLVRNSLESFGFDLERTASELLGTPLKWGSNGGTPEYLLLISGLFTNCAEPAGLTGHGETLSV